MHDCIKQEKLCTTCEFYESGSQYDWCYMFQDMPE